MNPECGGPAYPIADLSKTQCPGMTLRDWFAGQALAGMLAECGELKIPQTAEDAYRYADAMITERSKQ